MRCLKGYIDHPFLWTKLHSCIKLTRGTLAPSKMLSIGLLLGVNKDTVFEEPFCILGT